MHARIIVVDEIDRDRSGMDGAGESGGVGHGVECEAGGVREVVPIGEDREVGEVWVGEQGQGWLIEEVQVVDEVLCVLGGCGSKLGSQRCG